MALSNEAFAEKMKRALHAAGIADEFAFDPERFALVGTSHFFLGAAYQQYTSAPWWRRGKVLRAYVSAAVDSRTTQLPNTFDAARPNLVPVIRSSCYLDATHVTALTGNPGAARSPAQHLAGRLYAGVAYDTPSNLMLFTENQLQTWGVTFEEVLKAARFNLRMRSQEPLREVAPGVFVGPWEDANAAGRLLLTEVLTRLPVKGDLIAMVPGRDFLIVSGTEDAAGLSTMLEIAEKAVAQPKANTLEMFRLEGTAWVPWTLPQDHPLAAKHAELDLGSLLGEYQDQKQAIDAAHKETGIDVFVANFSAVKSKETGKLRSYCVWAPVISLLPRTDQIAFVRGEESAPQTIWVTWDAAVDVVGPLMKRDERFKLERYLVEVPPSEEQWQQLVSRAVVD